MELKTRVPHLSQVIRQKGIAKAATDRCTWQLQYCRTGLKRIRSVGIFQSIYNYLAGAACKLLTFVGVRTSGQTYNIYARRSRYALACRQGGSDRIVFNQVFGDDQYGCMHHIENPALIVDCGANVGYTSIYFLNRYPEAHVIAIEPDKSNFHVLERNTAYFSDRFSGLQSGVWSHKTGLVVGRGEMSDGLEWSYQVTECPDGLSPDIYAIDIGSILENSGQAVIDILKIDIEGSETVVFSASDLTWLDKVNNIVIELHGPECESAFFGALSNYTFTRQQSGELTVCTGIRRKI